MASTDGEVKTEAAQTARDAIGARVSLRLKDRLVTRQLMAGDGYMASNERVVEFGLGDTALVAEITIHWPSGATSRITAPPINSTLIVVEGLNQATQQQMWHLESISVSEIAPAPQL